MSVIKFSLSDFSSLTVTAKKNKEVRSLVLYSEKFARDRGDDEEESIDAILGRLFIHLWKANLFCFMAQYARYAKDLAEELSGTEELPKGKILERAEFLRQLRSLDYNLATNDGNHFVDPMWYELFQSVIRTMERSFADAVIYPSNY